MSFSIKKETRIAKYSLPLIIRNRKGKIVKILTATALISSLNSCFPLPGEPYIETVDRSTAIEIVEKEFSPITFQRDVKLTITDQSGDTIDLIADGYNADKRIVYELVSYYKTIYVNSKKEYLDPTSDVLTNEEIDKIKNYSFGDYFICYSYYDDEDSLKYDVNDFIKYYNTTD